MKFRFLIVALTAFVFQLQAQQAPASEILNQAKVEAQKSDKNILLIFHASWCGWCKLMENNLNKEEVKPLIEKDYVVSYLSVLERGEKEKTLENPGGRALMAQLKGENAGLPYWVVLNSKGEMIENSFDKNKENIGSPASAEEVKQFTEKLAKTSHLTSEELKIITKNFVKS